MPPCRCDSQHFPSLQPAHRSYCIGENLSKGQRYFIDLDSLLGPSHRVHLLPPTQGLKPAQRSHHRGKDIPCIVLGDHRQAWEPSAHAADRVVGKPAVRLWRASKREQTVERVGHLAACCGDVLRGASSERALEPLRGTGEFVRSGPGEPRLQFVRHSCCLLYPGAGRGNLRRLRAHGWSMALSRSARAVASEGPYQVSSRPETSTARWAGNTSGPSSAVNG